MAPGKTGDDGHFAANLGDLKAGEKLEAVAHTHPVSWRQGPASFSWQDMANLALTPGTVLFLRSGEVSYSVRMTPQLAEKVRRMTDQERRALWTEMNNFSFVQYWRAPGTTALKKSIAAIKATARKYGLEFYAGSGRNLQRVDINQ